MLVGEWSAALDSAAVRGRGRTTLAELTAGYVEAQLEGYADASGWCYWSYRTEHPDDWNFRHLVETGIIRL